MRETNLLVSADVEMMACDGEVTDFYVENIPCIWVWDLSSRETAEYWAVCDYVNSKYKYDWFSVKSWSASPIRKEK
jgi:hypothetical protein